MQSLIILNNLNVKKLNLFFLIINGLNFLFIFFIDN